MKIYISGPITGYDLDEVKARFRRAKRNLMVPGVEVINPMELALQDAEGQTWSTYLQRDLKELLTCDAVATLPGWAESRGASLEVHVAKELGYAVKPLEQWMAEIQRIWDEKLRKELHLPR